MADRQPESLRHSVLDDPTDALPLRDALPLVLTETVGLSLIFGA